MGWDKILLLIKDFLGQKKSRLSLSSGEKGCVF